MTGALGCRESHIVEDDKILYLYCKTVTGECEDEERAGRMSSRTQLQSSVTKARPAPLHNTRLPGVPSFIRGYHDEDGSRSSYYASFDKPSGFDVYDCEPGCNVYVTLVFSILLHIISHRFIRLRLDTTIAQPIVTDREEDHGRSLDMG